MGEAPQLVDDDLILVTMLYSQNSMAVPQIQNYFADSAGISAASRCYSVLEDAYWVVFGAGVVYSNSRCGILQWDQIKDLIS